MVKMSKGEYKKDEKVQILPATRDSNRFKKNKKQGKGNGQIFIEKGDYKDLAEKHKKMIENGEKMVAPDGTPEKLKIDAEGNGLTAKEVEEQIAQLAKEIEEFKKAKKGLKDKKKIAEVDKAIAERRAKLEVLQEK